MLTLQQISLGAVADLLVTTLITSNVQNDRVLSRALASAKHSSIQSIAYNIFAETVPSALLFSAAIASVVDYYADPSRKDELQKLIQLSTTAPADSADPSLLKLIAHALSKSLSTFRLIVETYRKAASGQEVSSINQRKCLFWFFTDRTHRFRMEYAVCFISGALF